MGEEDKELKTCCDFSGTY